MKAVPEYPNLFSFAPKLERLLTDINLSGYYKSKVNFIMLDISHNHNLWIVSYNFSKALVMLGKI